MQDVGRKKKESKKLYKFPQTRTSSGIIGVGSCLPSRRVTNNELAQYVETTDEWIQERVGIQSRHIASLSESTVKLAIDASKDALEQAGITPQELGLIIFATITPTQHLPSCAAMLQGELGAGPCLAFDLQAACSGFLFALQTAESLQRTQGLKYALVIGAENLTRVVDWKDRSTCVLFGDGAGAVVTSFTNSDSPCILASELHTDGSLSHLIERPGDAYPTSTLPKELRDEPENEKSPYMQMRGREVYKVAVHCMSSTINTVLERAGFTLEEVDLFVPHQSNMRMLDAVCDRIGLTDRSKMVANIDVVGNTSAASIPIALEHAVRQGRLKRGDLVLLTAVGSGMTYGSMLLRW